MEYYSALKRKEILIPAAWKNCEDIMLRETKRQALCDSTCKRYLEQSDLQRQKVEVGFWELGKGGMGSYCFMGPEFQF